eukprot:13293784-Ditylum_brightwellii.AAC.1
MANLKYFPTGGTTTLRMRERYDTIEVLVNDLNDVSGKGDIIAFTVNYSSDELSAIREFCIMQRNSMQCQGQYKMVIGTVWTLKSLQTFARAYGEFVYLDATEGTNKEE